MSYQGFVGVYRGPGCLLAEICRRLLLTPTGPAEAAGGTHTRRTLELHAHIMHWLRVWTSCVIARVCVCVHVCVCVCEGYPAPLLLSHGPLPPPRGMQTSVGTPLTRPIVQPPGLGEVGVEVSSCGSGRFLDDAMRSRPSLFRHRSSWGVLANITPVMFSE